jgi:hypothetical protein
VNDLGEKLLTKFNIPKPIRYDEHTTLLKLTGLPLNDSDVVRIDWLKSGLWQNLSAKFNKQKNKLYLTESQLSYSINLLRYCASEFDQPDKLQQMFNLTIATC